MRLCSGYRYCANDAEKHIVRMKTLVVTTATLSIVLSLLAGITACPPWESEGRDGRCQCGDSLGGVVYYNSRTEKLYILKFYCMTYNTRSNQTTVGKCLDKSRTTAYPPCSFYIAIETKNVTHLNAEVCGSFNRTGQLCGECVRGHGPPVYSYSSICAKCERSKFAGNAAKYFLVAFLPVTLMFLASILLNVSVTSGKMVAFVLICQVYSVPNLMEVGLQHSTDSLLLYSFFSLWNLDIFRSLYTPFCLHPSLNTMHVTALEYLIAVYPILLMILTYLATTILGNFKLHLVYVNINRTRRNSNTARASRGSLLNTFATFLVLSYSKILTTSLTLLTPVYIYTQNGEHGVYLFNNGEIPYFGGEHLPFGILAITMLTLCNIFPVVLLLLYPSLIQPKVNNQALTTFMDVFQGCYRHHPRDYRFFSAVPFIFRIVVCLLLVLIQDALFLPLAGFSFLLLVALLMLIKPYKQNYQNYVNIFLYMTSALLCFCFMLTHDFMRFIKPSLGDYRPVSTIPASLLLAPPVIYGIALLLHKVLPQRALTYFLQCISKFKAK